MCPKGGESKERYEFWYDTQERVLSKTIWVGDLHLEGEQSLAVSFLEKYICNSQLNI